MSSSCKWRLGVMQPKPNWYCDEGSSNNSWSQCWQIDSLFTKNQTLHLQEIKTKSRFNMFTCCLLVFSSRSSHDTQEVLTFLPARVTNCSLHHYCWIKSTFAQPFRQKLNRVTFIILIFGMTFDLMNRHCHTFSLGSALNNDTPPCMIVKCFQTSDATSFLPHFSWSLATVRLY